MSLTVKLMCLLFVACGPKCSVWCQSEAESDNENSEVKDPHEDTTSEMDQVLREMQATCNEKLATQRVECETYSNPELEECLNKSTNFRQEIAFVEAWNNQLTRQLEFRRWSRALRDRTLEAENTELWNEVAKLRTELDAILKEPCR